MNERPTGTVTFLFTDIEGSTKLAQEHPATWESLRKRHDDILRRQIEAHQGYIFQVIGDAFCAAFHTAREAFNAALDSQRELQGEDWGQTPVKVRMGIHSGEAELQADGHYRGYLALSRVQRLMSAGHGGQVLLSLATQELVRNGLPEQVSLRDLGEHRLKDLIQPERIYQAEAPDLPCDFPALRTLDAQLNNLPSQLTPFVGRERELAAVIGLLRNPTVRLVTLTGVGGTGKTRLSLQAAAELLDEFEHGVWFVELAAITNPELVLPTIASTLRVKEAASTVEQALESYLHEKQLLLVLDNFEQVVSAGPRLASLLSTAPKVKMLISSREVLRLRGEHDYPVPPLGLPATRRKQTPAVLSQYEAIALFVQEAQAADPAFELDEENAGTVAEICTRLDGLPLALELAAARSRLLKPAAMFERLKNKLDTLTGGARDLPRRQQTMRGAIDWSYDLLEEAEKVLFARLGVFHGGWTLEAADAVCGPGPGMEVVDGLESLLDKSLIRQADGKSGETRFSMLETIREYAFEKLSRAGEMESVQQAHAGFIAELLEQLKIATNSAEEVAWFSRLDDELDNLRSAVEWTLAKGQPDVALKAGILNQYWNQRANFREPLHWLERALAIEADGPSTERAEALNGAGNLSLQLNDVQHAREYFVSALALFRQMNDKKGIRVLNNLGNIAWREKDFEKARQLYEETLAGIEPGTFAEAMVLNNLGSLARIRGDWEESRSYYVRSQAICERVGAEAGLSYTYWFLGNLALVQGKLEEAQTHYQKCMEATWLRSNPLIRGTMQGIMGYILLLKGRPEEARPLLKEGLESALEYSNHNPEPPNIAHILEGKARLESAEGCTERAAQLFGASGKLREEGDFLVTEAEGPDYEAVITATRTAMGEAAFERAFEKGKAMALKEAISFALAETG